MSDKRLIDANALRQKIEKWADSADNSISFADSVESFAYDEVLDAIDAAPTIDPEALQPVAHWVCEEDYDGDPVVWTCSHCKDSSIMYDGTPKDNGFKFCPYCGAKMEE